jgi:hypothetical protein
MLRVWGDIPEDHGDTYDRLRSSKAFGIALDKLPKYKGTLYRGSALQPSEFSKVKLGSIVTLSKHSAATSVRSAAFDAALDHISDLKDQTPVLFKGIRVMLIQKQS